MKYSKKQIESHFKWAANNKTPITDKWIDWCAKSMFIIQEMMEENERYRAALDGLIISASKEANEKGAGVFHLARIHEAMRALKGEE